MHDECLLGSRHSCVAARSQLFGLENKRRSEVNRVEMQNGNSRQHLYFSAALACVLVLLTIVATGQSTSGTLRGQVLDPQGAAIATAKIRITNQDTGVVSNTASSSAGTWNVPSLIPGKYSVSIEAPGFRAFVRKDVVVFADRDNTANAQLQVGTATEILEVIGTGVAIDTSSSSLSNDFNSQDVLNLPNAGGILKGSPLNLAVLAPNVVAQPGGVTGMGGSVGGTRPRENNFTVDGVDDNNLGVTGQIPR